MANLKNVEIKDLVLVAATRGMIGFGAGLLLANRFNHDRRRNLGWTLLVTGLVSTLPIAVHLFKKRTLIGP
jgi:hypothetical protein